MLEFFLPQEIIIFFHFYKLITDTYFQHYIIKHISNLHSYTASKQQQNPVFHLVLVYFHTPLYRGIIF